MWSLYFEADGVLYDVAYMIITESKKCHSVVLMSNSTNGDCPILFLLVPELIVTEQRKCFVTSPTPTPNPPRLPPVQTVGSD